MTQSSGDLPRIEPIHYQQWPSTRLAFGDSRWWLTFSLCGSPRREHNEHLLWEMTTRVTAYARCRRERRQTASSIDRDGSRGSATLRLELPGIRNGFLRPAAAAEPAIDAVISGLRGLRWMSPLAKSQ